MKTIANAYELKKQREYVKKRREEKEEREEAKKAKRNHFNWDLTTVGFEKDITFTDYLLDLLLADNGHLLKMYKRIKVNGKRLDIKGNGAIREITRKIKDAGGKTITEDAVRGKIRRIDNLFKKVSGYEYESGRGIQEDGLTVQGNTA